jgi:hypothetical protein
MEKRGLKVFENRLLRRLFGSKRDEVAWECRVLYMSILEEMLEMFANTV